MGVGVAVGVRKCHVSLNPVRQHCGEHMAQVTSLGTKLEWFEDTGRAHNESSSVPTPRTTSWRAPFP